MRKLPSMMTSALLTAGLIAGTVTSSPANAQDVTAPVKVPGVSGSNRLDQAFFLKTHNTYDHSNDLANWLRSGWRALELDLNLDDGSDPNPIVDHASLDGRNNCGGPRLRDCLERIRHWVQGARPSGPILVALDLQGISESWETYDIEAVDKTLEDVMGSMVWGYDDLMNHLGKPSDPRSSLNQKGWPTLSQLAGKVLFFYQGANHFNGNQRLSDWAPRQKHAFVCPDVESGEHSQIFGTVDGMGGRSNLALCKNLQAGDHHERVMNEANKSKQILFFWGDPGDFNSYNAGYTYVAIAHGASVIALDSSKGLNDSGTTKPSSINGIVPNTGLRRGLPGYMNVVMAGRCFDISGADFSNGTDIKLHPCNGNIAQEWVYTAEGQFRTRAGGNYSRSGKSNYCLDIDGGDAGVGKQVHLWGCDGGNSEKWDIDLKNMWLKNRDKDYKYCINQIDTYERVEVGPCDNSSNKTVSFRRVD